MRGMTRSDYFSPLDRLYTIRSAPAPSGGATGEAGKPMQSHAPSLSTVLTATYATPNGVADFREVAGQLRLAAPDQQAALERGEGRWRIAWDAYCDHVTFEWEDSDQPWPRLCAACEGPVADNGDLCVQCSYDEQIEWWAGLSDREREEQAMKHPENRAFL